MPENRRSEVNTTSSLNLEDIVLAIYSEYPVWPGVVKMCHQRGFKNMYTAAFETNGRSLLHYWVYFPDEDNAGWVRHDLLIRYHPTLADMVRKRAVGPYREKQRQALMLARTVFKAREARAHGLRKVSCPTPRELQFMNQMILYATSFETNPYGGPSTPSSSEASSTMSLRSLSPELRMKYQVLLDTVADAKQKSKWSSKCTDTSQEHNALSKVSPPDLILVTSQPTDDDVEVVDDSVDDVQVKHGEQRLQQRMQLFGNTGNTVAGQAKVTVATDTSGAQGKVPTTSVAYPAARAVAMAVERIMRHTMQTKRRTGAARSPAPYAVGDGNPLRSGRVVMSDNSAGDEGERHDNVESEGSYGSVTSNRGDSLTDEYVQPRRGRRSTVETMDSGDRKAVLGDDTTVPQNNDRECGQSSRRLGVARQVPMAYRVLGKREMWHRVRSRQSASAGSGTRRGYGTRLVEVIDLTEDD